MELIVEKGNLFDLDEKYSLAHCISLDCAMGAGIAVEFDKRFKGMKRDLINTVKSNSLNHPITIQYGLDDNDRKVFNMITKEKYWHKPTYQTLAECLEQLRYFVNELGIKYLAMPKIGCGLDRLQWGTVLDMIKREFEDVDVQIVVRYL